jgi:hypothetical protein
MSNQAYGFKKDARFGKQHDVAEIYNQFLDKADLIEDSDDELDVAAAKIMWGERAFDDESALGQTDQGYLQFRYHEG